MCFKNGEIPYKKNHYEIKTCNVKPLPDQLRELDYNKMSNKSTDIWAEDMKDAITTALKEGNRTKAEQLNDELIFQLGYGLDLDATINEDPNYEN